MFHSSSSYNNDPAFCCSAGQSPLTGSLNPVVEVANAATLSSSLPSGNYFMHRSSSTHSFTHHHHHLARYVPDPTAVPFSLSSPSSACDFLDFHPDPLRRVFSTGDLQGMNCLQASTETGMQEATAMAGRVGRYNAEERMKRIERYRSKRNQRNFQKKISYACRKTLADSRPRVRGRFARNGETEMETEPEPEADASEISCESYNNHSSSNYDSCANYNDYENYYSIHNNNNNDSCATYNDYNDMGNAGDWWRQMQAALTTADEDLWADFDSVFSVNLLS